VYVKRDERISPVTNMGAVVSLAVDGKTGAMTATNMDGNEYYELVCPAATGAFAGLRDIAGSDGSRRDGRTLRSLPIPVN
jgi:hypothetical protein